MKVYRVKDNVTYSVVIEEFDSEKGGWRPYTAEDVQVRGEDSMYTTTRRTAHHKKPRTKRSPIAYITLHYIHYTISDGLHDRWIRTNA